MIGGIIGDIVGSVYEFTPMNIKSKDFLFFDEQGSYTDDSILSVATADWLLHGGDVAHYYSRYGAENPWPKGGYGGGFQCWIVRSSRQGDYRPYDSCGNGSGMRVGPVGWAFETREEVLEAAKKSAECTHNHPEGIKGAQAIALCVFMARKGFSKEDIRKEIEKTFHYDLNFTCDGIRDTYQWGGTCQESVPQAIVAFLDGEDFEDCIRNAISIGGDSDTIGCMTGSIAEAYFGVPKLMYEKAMSLLDWKFCDIVEEFEEKYGNKVIYYPVDVENVFPLYDELSHHFPWDDVEACINDKIAPKAQHTPCPMCGKPSEKLEWIHFCSPMSTWKSLCGREGPLSICPDCHYQVEFICEVMN